MRIISIQLAASNNAFTIRRVRSGLKIESMKTHLQMHKIDETENPIVVLQIHYVQIYFLLKFHLLSKKS